MSTFKFPLPNNIVKLVEKSQRQALGLKTMDEIAAAVEIKSEKQLAVQVENLLRLRGIEFFSSRRDRRTTRPVGEPDLVFSVWVKDFDKERQVIKSWPLACAWELKIAGRALSLEQQKMFERMITKPNSWHCACIRSVDDALNELRKLGL